MLIILIDCTNGDSKTEDLSKVEVLNNLIDFLSVEKYKITSGCLGINIIGSRLRVGVS